MMPGFPLLPHPIPACVALLVIVTASTDIVSRRIPNPIILAGLVAALLVQGWRVRSLASRYCCRFIWCAAWRRETSSY
jgi:Flp pilus assembly protein protease CpaA